MEFPRLDGPARDAHSVTVPFARVARRERPPFDELLLALAAEFRPVDRHAALNRLDDLGRRLFGLESLEASLAGRRMAEILGAEVGLRARTHGLGCLFFDEVLRQGAGHPILLAVAYLEAGRRAGLRPSLFSTRSAWLVGLGGSDELTVVDPAPRVGLRLDGEDVELRRHCPHEVAYAVLGGLRASLHARGNEAAARTADDLRSLLAVQHHGLDSEAEETELG